MVDSFIDAGKIYIFVIYVGIASANSYNFMNIIIYNFSKFKYLWNKMLEKSMCYKWTNKGKETLQTNLTFEPLFRERN